MAGAFGFFGKIPALGDFVRGGGVPRPFVNSWDTFLQTGLITCRKALGDRWAETYQTAPIWRFALGCDVIEGGPFTGVMMPSQDAVGRLFPLTIVATATPPADGLADDGFYLPIEDAALAMLDSLRDKAALERLVVGFLIPPTSAIIDSSQSMWLSAPGEGFGTPLGLSIAGLPDADSFATLLTQDLTGWGGQVIKGAAE